jgi:hypothetical protein
MRQITATALREDARRRAHEAVERLAALNRSSRARNSTAPSPATPLSRIPDAQLQAMLEVYYARFVSRRTAVTP